MNWLTSEPNDRLRAILGPPPTTPWAALLPQMILWSFRRFCVEHLLDAGTAALQDFIWTDMGEFIEKYAPSGLDVSDWITPEHVGELHSSIEAYNDFCTEIIQQFDAALMDENEPVQNAISDFLDGLHEPIYEWLGDSRFKFFIGPYDDIDEIDSRICEVIEHNIAAFYDETEMMSANSELEAETLPDLIEEVPIPSILRRTLRSGRQAFTPSRIGKATRHAAKRGKKPPALNTE